MRTRLVPEWDSTAAALAFLAASPAMATGRKHPPAHHAQSSSSSEHMTTEQLNAQSLSAAQQGQNFTPSAPSSTPSGGGSSRM